MAGGFFGVLGLLVTKCRGEPKAEGFVVDVVVGVDEDGGAGRMSEHGAGVTGGHMWKIRVLSTTSSAAQKRCEAEERWAA